MRIISQFIEMYPIPDDKQDFFSGFYNLNSMLIQIARKQEFQRIVRISSTSLSAS
jgi:hypothetical protein